MGQYYMVLMKQNKKQTVFDRSVDGDYTMAKLMEHSWWENPFVNSISNKIYNKPAQIWWVGDYAEDINPKVYKKVWGENAKTETIRESQIDLYEKFLINHTKKIYIDCKKYWKNSVTKDKWCIHPLPLLTALGNGLGGGDYFAEVGKELIGTWAGDLLEISKTKPDYEEIEVVFKEYE